MAIATRDELINALGNNNSRIILDKATIANQTAGTFVSMWQATGQPGNGASPTSAANCTNATTGGIAFTQQTAPATSYIAYLEMAFSNNAMTGEIHDRLMHMGGLSGTVATPQTVGMDFDGVTADNMVARIGGSDYGDIQWWLEWYTTTGSTAVTATVAVTYSDTSTGNLTAISLAATRRNGFMQPLNSYIPSAKAGLFIRAVNTVTLSATTGTAGNFGVTATRPRCSISSPIANYKTSNDWAQLGLPEVPNAACLAVIVLTSTTSTGTLRGGGKIVHG